MIILTLGLLLIIAGALSIRFPDMVDSLKANDRSQWELLGSPPSYAFSKTIGVFSWILSRGYEQSPSPDVHRLGERYLNRARFAKYAMLCGAVLLSVGFIAALSSLQG